MVLQNAGADVLERGLSMLLEVVVAANNRAHDRRGITQQLLQKAAWSDRSRFETRLQSGLVLAADSTKELIEVMDHAAAHTRILGPTWEGTRPGWVPPSGNVE